MKIVAIIALKTQSDSFSTHPSAKKNPSETQILFANTFRRKKGNFFYLFVGKNYLLDVLWNFKFLA